MAISSLFFFFTPKHTRIDKIQFPRVQRTCQSPRRERDEKAAVLVWAALVQHPSLVRGVDRGGPQLFVRM